MSTEPLIAPVGTAGLAAGTTEAGRQAQAG